MRLDASMMQLSPSGELILTLPRARDQRLRYGPWQAGLPLHRWVAGQWVHVCRDPRISLLQAAEDPGSAEPIVTFTAAIPEEIRRRARAYLYVQTRLLQWVAGHPAAADLFQHSPHLVWLLVAVATQEGWPPREIHHCLTQRRVAILERLSGLRSEAAVKFLNRVVLRHGDAHELHLIKTILRTPALWQGLHQWARIPVHVLAILLNYPEFSGSRLLQHIADGEYPRLADALAPASHAAERWRDTLGMGRVLEISDAPQALARCQTLAALERLHDRWTDRLNRRKCLVVDGQHPFPAPPLPGNEVIHPILSEEDLQAEGQVMGHCVASHVDRVRRGESYIYRLLHPERATIELQLGGSQPVLGQLKAARNQTPRSDSQRVVMQWLDDWSQGKAAPAATAKDDALPELIELHENPLISLCICLGPEAETLLTALRARTDDPLDRAIDRVYVESGMDPGVQATWLADVPPCRADIIMLVIDAQDPYARAASRFWTKRLTEMGMGDTLRTALVIGGNHRNSGLPWRQELSAHFHGVIDLCQQRCSLRQMLALLLAEGLLCFRQVFGFPFDPVDVRALFSIAPQRYSAVGVWNGTEDLSTVFHRMLDDLLPYGALHIESASMFLHLGYPHERDHVKEGLRWCAELERYMGHDAWILPAMLRREDWPAGRQAVVLIVALDSAEDARL